MAPQPPIVRRRLGRLQATVHLLHLIALIVGVLALIYFAFAFRTVIEGVTIALGRRSFGPLLPLALATVGSWSMMYLLHDKLGILGSARARAVLLPHAEALCTDEVSLARHFVELRVQGRRGPFTPDWGWLLVFPDRLEFTGVKQRITLPRALVAGSPETEPNAKGLLPTWLDLPVRADWKGMAFMCRDSARSLSDTARDAEALRVALVSWLRSPAPAEPLITPGA